MTARCKKIVLLAISVLLLFSLVTPVFAATQNTGTEDVTMNKTVASIIKNQLTDEEWSDLRNTRKYDDSMKGKRISDQVVLRTYLLLPWNNADKSLPEIISLEEEYFNQYASAHFPLRYLVLDKTPYIAKVTRGDKNISVSDDFSSAVPSYVKDILMLQDHFQIDGENCTLRGIYCFDDSTSHVSRETLVYLDTDKGVFVRYYPDVSSEGVLYSDEEFAQNAVRYYEYRTSRWNEEMTVGRGYAFFEYLRDNEIELKQLALEQDEPVPAPKTNWVVPVIAVAVIVCGTVALLLIRHKRRKSTDQTEEPGKTE